MASDSDWVQDVRRWYFGSNPPFGDQASSTSETGAESDAMMGYEAANPSLQARHWPDALPVDATVQS